MKEFGASDIAINNIPGILLSPNAITSINAIADNVIEYEDFPDGSRRYGIRMLVSTLTGSGSWAAGAVVEIDGAGKRKFNIIGIMDNKDGDDKVSLRVFAAGKSHNTLGSVTYLTPFTDQTTDIEIIKPDEDYLYNKGVSFEGSSRIHIMATRMNGAVPTLDVDTILQMEIFVGV